MPDCDMGVKTCDTKQRHTSGCTWGHMEVGEGEGPKEAGLGPMLGGAEGGGAWKYLSYTELPLGSVWEEVEGCAWLPLVGSYR